MGKYTHVLAPRKGGRPLRRAIVIGTADTEHPVPGSDGDTVAHLDWWCAYRLDTTRDEPLGPYAGAADETWFFWAAAEQAANKRYVTYVFATAPWRTYTQMGLWQWLETADVQVTSVCFRAQTFICEVRTHRGTLVFLGVENFYRCSLRDLAGLASREDPQAAGYVLAGVGDPDQTADAVARVLTECVRRLGELLEAHGKPSMGYTIASVAWNAWLQTAAGCPVEVHDDPTATTLERGAYFGGRFDVMTWGRTVPSAHVVDVNSMYGWAMDCPSIPTSLAGVYTGDGMAASAAHRNGMEAIAHVRLVTDRHTYPVRLKGRTVHARGDYWTTLAGPELTRAYQYGEVREVAAVALYECGPVFRSAIGRWLSARVEAKRAGEHAEATLLKLMVCSLYGRFGAWDYPWREEPDAIAWRRWGQWSRRAPGRTRPDLYRAVRGVVYSVKERSEGPHSFPGIAAVVTSRARVRMDEYVDVAGVDDVHYRDPDALHVSDRGLARLEAACCIDPLRVGALKVRAQLADVTYWGPCDYTHSAGRVTAGLPAGSVQTGPGTYYYQESPGIDALLDDRERQSVLLKRRVVEIRRGGYAGRVDQYGRVHDVRLPEAASAGDPGRDGRVPPVPEDSVLNGFLASGKAGELSDVSGMPSGTSDAP